MTFREREVIASWGRGDSATDIAAELCMTVGEVLEIAYTSYDLKRAIERISKCLIQQKDPQRDGLPQNAPHQRTKKLVVDLELNPDEFFVGFANDSLSGPCGKGKTMKAALRQFAAQLDNDPLYRSRS